jgi:hypothetical protein
MTTPDLLRAAKAIDDHCRKNSAGGIFACSQMIFDLRDAIAAAEAQPAAAPRPRNFNDEAVKALSKLQRRCDAYKVMIDAVATKNGGLRHKIKSLQSYIAKLKEQLNGQQVSTPAESARPPQGAAVEVPSRGQDEPEEGGARLVGQPAHQAGARGGESGVVVEQEGHRADPVKSAAAPDADLDAAIGAWEEEATDSQCRGLQTQEGHRVYMIGGDTLDKAIALMRRARQAAAPGVELAISELEAAAREAGDSWDHNEAVAKINRRIAALRAKPAAKEGLS